MRRMIRWLSASCVLWVVACFISWVRRVIALFTNGPAVDSWFVYSSLGGLMRGKEPVEARKKGKLVTPVEALKRLKW